MSLEQLVLSESEEVLNKLNNKGISKGHESRLKEHPMPTMGQFEQNNNSNNRSNSKNNNDDDNELHHKPKYNICEFILACLFILLTESSIYREQTILILKKFNL